MKYQVKHENDRGNRSYSILRDGVEIAFGSSGAGAYETPGSVWVHYGSAPDGGLTRLEWEIFIDICW